MDFEQFVICHPGHQHECATPPGLTHPAGDGPEVEFFLDVDHREALHHRRVRVHAEGLCPACPQVGVES